jgi:predicted HicB family RNase H-like nuclease
MMPRDDDTWVQLATRIPKTLHRALKLHCVHAEVSVMDFVVQAIDDKLGRDARRKRKAG